MRLGLVLAAVALTLLLAACQDEPPADEPRSSSSESTSSADEFSPSALESWPATPSCGEWENRNEPVSAEQMRRNRCFLDAFAEGSPAELYVTYTTVEGDPIRVYFRVLGAGRVEAFIDSTEDSYGPREWTHLLCEGISPSGGFGLLTGDDCSELPLDRAVSSTG